MPVTTTTPSTTALLPAYCPEVCLTFSDSSYVTSQGTKSVTVLQVTSTPADGTAFTFAGVVWTFKTTPVADTFDVQIGSSASTTALNLQAALLRSTLITQATHTITRVISTLTITAVKFGAASTLSFTSGTAPVNRTSFTAGVDASVASPWDVSVRLSTRSTSNALDYDDSPPVVVSPLVVASPYDGTLSMGASLPLGSFARSLLRTLPPDTSMASVLQPGAVVEMKALTRLNTGPVATSSAFLFIAAQCPGHEEPDVLDYISPFYALTGNDVRWAMHVSSGDTYCPGARPVFSAFVGTSPLTITITGPGAGGEIADPFTPSTPSRVMGLEVNPNASLFQPLYSGEVAIEMAPASGPGYEVAGYSTDGDCACGHYLTFFNGFGMFESCPLSPVILSDSLEVSASPVLAPTSCGVPSPAPFIEAANRASRILTVKVPEQRMGTHAHRARMDALLRSPEVWYEYLDVDGEWRRVRVTLQRGDTALRETAQPSMNPEHTTDILLDLRLPDERGNANNQ